MTRKFYLLFVAFTIAIASIGQTNPAAQVLPYSQDFSTLAHTSTTYPAGWQGWLQSGSPSDVFSTAAPVIDSSLRASGAANNTSAGLYNYNGKIGIQITGSVNLSLALSLNTTSNNSIQIAYDIMTIRNAQDANNSRINEVILQYRIGTAGTFTNITGSEYQNNTTNQTTGTTPQNLQRKTVTLPAICNDKPVVQVRWISRQVSGSGGRPSFAVDNINVNGSTAADVTAPLALTFSPANNATNVPQNLTASITFDESIQKGIGNIILKKSSDNSTIQTISVTNSSVTVSGASASFTFNNLMANTEYYIAIDNGAFQDLAANSFVGFSTASTWSFTTGSTIITYDFSTCISSLSDGFTQQSVIGAQVWGCNTAGRTGNGVLMNGFTPNPSTNNANEDWLISPALDLSTTANPILSFYSRTDFPGATLRLYITSNFTGNVSNTTWTELNGFFPAANSDVWTLSDNIDLSAFKQANVRFAFKYTSTTTDGSRWSLDDISIINSATPPPAIFTLNTSLVDFRYQAAGTTTTGKPFNFSLNNLQSNVTLTAPTGFELSKDNSSFAASITYTSAEAQSTTTAFVRLIAASASTVYAGSIQFAAANFNTSPVYIKGNTFDLSNTLNLASWNIRFFGQTSTGSPDPAQQQANAKTVIEALNPDIMAAVEIVDVTRFSNLVSSLSGGYSYVLAEHCSGNGTTASACATAQKVGLIYKTSVMSNVTARPYMITSDSAKASFASGRVPLLVSGDVTKNGQTTTMNFLVIHAKANTGNTADQVTSYNQRKKGNRELKDSLEAQFSSSNIVMLGDFNDDLDRTIAPTTGADTVSSYQNFVSDSTDAVSYRSVTLPLSNLKTRSTTDFDNVIDHMIVSDEMSSRILRQSATVYTDIQEVTGITNFGTSTSDHYPIMARFFFGGVLPIRLSDFTASKQGSGIQVQWNTAEEINTKEFAVEHSSDGRNFKQIGVIRALNNTSGSAYSFLHAQPAAGNNFYRLKTIDFDAKAQLSRIVKVSMNKAFTVSLSPNPAKNSVAVSLAGTTSPVQLELLNASGQVVKTLKLTNSLTNLPLDGLKAGLYLVRLKNGAETMTERLLID